MFFEHQKRRVDRLRKYETLDRENTDKEVAMAHRMSVPCVRLVVFSFAFLFIWSTGPISGEVLLNANFDNKSIDQPIGTGGAAVGEPTDVNINVTAYVRDTPTPTPSLEISGGDTPTTGAVRFELLESLEITQGTVVVDVALWFIDDQKFFLSIKEQGGSVHTFAKVYTAVGGAVRLSDANGYYGIIGSFTVGTTHQVRLVFDMDAGTYDVLLDGTPVVEDRSHGVLDRGIGGAIFGVDWSAPADSAFHVDDLLITADSFIFTDGFESGDMGAWSSAVN